MTENIPENQFEATLLKYRGAFAQIWLYSVSRKRLVVRLSIEGQKPDLFILVAGCEYIKGSFSWERSDFNIVTRQVGNEGSQAVGIEDKEGGFSLYCNGGVFMIISSDNDLWNHFDS